MGFEESQKQGTDTVIVPRLHFHDSSDGQNRETCLTSDIILVHPSNPKSHGQSQDVETATDNNIMTVPHEHLSQIRTLKLHINLCNNHLCDNPSTLEINDPTTNSAK